MTHDIKRALIEKLRLHAEATCNPNNPREAWMLFYPEVIKIISNHDFMDLSYVEMRLAQIASGDYKACGHSAEEVAADALRWLKNEQQQGEVAVVDDTVLFDLMWNAIMDLPPEIRKRLAIFDIRQILNVVPDAIRPYLHSPSQWQDIATAPKDGTAILSLSIGVGNIPSIVWWQVGEWCGKPYEGWFDCNTIYELLTHWMPLPSPPTTKTEEQQP